jgi:DNA-binding FadR family transcriptional regulator
MAEFQALEAEKSIAVRIAEQLVIRIRSGDFPVGTKLPSEMELARQFGVSRPSVREALGALQFVGYIDSTRGSGSQVTSREPVVDHTGLAPAEVAPRDVLRLFEARLLIEPQVAALAARNPDLEKLEEAEDLIEGMGLVVNRSTLYGETDLRVHRAIATVCQNSFMTASALKLLDVMASPQLRDTRVQAWRNRVLPPLWGCQHTDIVTAIRGRNAATAAAATWDHLVSSARNALTVLAVDSSVDDAMVTSFKQFLDSGPESPDIASAGPRSHRTGGQSHARNVEK